MPDPTVSIDNLALITKMVGAKLARQGPTVQRHADLITDSIGFVRPSTDASVSGSRGASVVERTAVDQELIYVRQWEQALHQLARALHAVDQAMAPGRLLPTSSADHIPAGAGTCLSCSRWVSGAETDRLRSGLCDACRVAVRRMMAADPNLERAAAVARRRARGDVWDNTTVDTAGQ